MELNDDDYERLKEIRSLPAEFAEQAFNWWNEEANDAMKRFIIVSTYYEYLAHASEFIDNIVVDWSNGGEV